MFNIIKNLQTYIFPHIFKSIQAVNQPRNVTDHRELLLKHFEACRGKTCLAQLHALTIKSGLTGSTLFASKLVNLYSKWEHLGNHRKLFDELPQRTLRTWNLILKRCCKEKQYKETFVLFSDLFSVEKPDSYSISTVLKACGEVKALDYGRIIHGFVVKCDYLGMDLFVGSCLVELYSKCGQMGSGLCVFEEYPEPDSVLWSGVISGYGRKGEGKEAIEFFARMVRAEGAAVDEITLVSVVSSCSKIEDLNGGKSVHGYAIRAGFHFGLPLLNALLSFYGKMGCVDIAANLFRVMRRKDVISWGSIVASYAHHGEAEKALGHFVKMVCNGIEPNDVVLITALQACEAIGNLEMGKQIHNLVARKGICSHIMLSTALIDMYMNCFSPHGAIMVFDSMPFKDVVCFSALLCGCVQNGMHHKSVEVLCEMLVNNICPSSFDMVRILRACSELGVHTQTSWIHGFLTKAGLNENSFVAASLIESYAKCGSLDNAVAVFGAPKDKDVVIWSSMIAGYGLHGKGHEALELFNEMISSSSVTPNEVSFVSILSACSHAGLIQEGIELFNIMVNNYKLIPNLKHYGIVVDLLGRIGELDKALEFIGLIPEPAGPNVWGALLGACRIYQNREVGEIAAKKLIKLDPSQTGHHILLSNLYSADENWNDAAEVRKLLEEKQLKKVSGQSVIELRDGVCTFTANDRTHQDSEQIYDLIAKLDGRMREEIHACEHALSAA